MSNQDSQSIAISTVSTSEAIEHQNVPQEHRGLHDFLYSSTDEHEAETAPDVAIITANTPITYGATCGHVWSEATSRAAKVCSEATSEPCLALDPCVAGREAIEDWCNATQNAKVAGVYAVLNSDQQTQYIGYSRNVGLSLRSHLTAHGAEICALVKVQPFKFPKREEMEQLRDRWISELPSPPPGNIDGSSEWASTVRDAAAQVMSAADRAVYEEKKLKLRKAMADDSLHQEESAAAEDLAAKIQDDNWSAVISEQTKETH